MVTSITNRMSLAIHTDLNQSNYLIKVSSSSSKSGSKITPGTSLSLLMMANKSPDRDWNSSPDLLHSKVLTWVSIGARRSHGTCLLVTVVSRLPGGSRM